MTSLSRPPAWIWPCIRQRVPLIVLVGVALLVWPGGGGTRDAGGLLGRALGDLDALDGGPGPR